MYHERPIGHFFSTSDVSERLKGKIYSGGVLAVLLYGCESWCLTAESISRLRNWHNKRIREMCRGDVSIVCPPKIFSELTEALIEY